MSKFMCDLGNKMKWSNFDRRAVGKCAFNLKQATYVIQIISSVYLLIFFLLGTGGVVTPAIIGKLSGIEREISQFRDSSKNSRPYTIRFVSTQQK